MNTYAEKQRVRLTATFTDLAGAVGNTTVTASVKSPSGVVTNPSVTNNGVGIYYFDLDLAEAGVYTYRFEGTVTLVAAVEQTLKSHVSEFYTS